MAALFSNVNSGLVQKFYGRVISSKQAGGSFSRYTEISVAVDTRAKGQEQYAPNIIISAFTEDESIEVKDRVVIEGILQDREYNGKTYYKLSPFVVLPTVVIEKAGGGQAPAAKKSSAPKTQVVDDLEDDF